MSLGASPSLGHDLPGLAGPALGLNVHFGFSGFSSLSSFSTLAFFAGGALAFALPLPLTSSSSESSTFAFFGAGFEPGLATGTRAFLGLTSSSSVEVTEASLSTTLDLRFFAVVALAGDFFFGLTSTSIASESESSILGARFLEAEEVEALGFALEEEATPESESESERTISAGLDLLMVEEGKCLEVVVGAGVFVVDDEDLRKGGERTETSAREARAHRRAAE